MTDTNNLAAERIQPLLKGRKAPGDFYDEVARQLIERNADLIWGKVYDAKDLVDPEFWGDDKGIHILIGRCIAHLVATGKVRLCFASCARCTIKRYQRI